MKMYHLEIIRVIYEAERWVYRSDPVYNETNVMLKVSASMREARASPWLVELIFGRGECGRGAAGSLRRQEHDESAV